MGRVSIHASELFSLSRVLGGCTSREIFELVMAYQLHMSRLLSSMFGSLNIIIFVNLMYTV